MNTSKQKTTKEIQQAETIENYGLIFNFMQSAMIAASVSIDRGEVENAQEWLLNTLEGVDRDYWPEKDEDLNCWAKAFQEGKNFSCEFDKLKARNNELFYALYDLLKSLYETEEAAEFCGVEQVLAEMVLRKTLDHKTADYVTREQMNEKVIEAVADARKDWMTQGCPEKKWNPPESVPDVPEGEERLYWIATSSKETGFKPHVRLAHYQNVPLKVDENGDPIGDCFYNPDGEPIESIGWVEQYEHYEFNRFYEGIAFNEDYRLLGWSEYHPPAF